MDFSLSSLSGMRYTGPLLPAGCGAGQNSGMIAIDGADYPAAGFLIPDPVFPGFFRNDYSSYQCPYGRGIIGKMRSSG